MDLKDLKVELIPHVGKQAVSLGGETVVVDVVFDQCRVQVNGQYKAIYCGQANQPDCVVAFIEPLPLPIQEAVVAKVKELTGGVKSFNAPVPEEHEVSDDE